MEFFLDKGLMEFLSHEEFYRAEHMEQFNVIYFAMPWDIYAAIVILDTDWVRVKQMYGNRKTLLLSQN